MDPKRERQKNRQLMAELVKRTTLLESIIETLVQKIDTLISQPKERRVSSGIHPRKS